VQRAGGKSAEGRRKMLEEKREGRGNKALFLPLFSCLISFSSLSHLASLPSLIAACSRPLLLAPISSEEKMSARKRRY